MPMGGAVLQHIDFKFDKIADFSLSLAVSTQTFLDTQIDVHQCQGGFNQQQQKWNHYFHVRLTELDRAIGLTPHSMWPT